MPRMTMTSTSVQCPPPPKLRPIQWRYHWETWNMSFGSTWSRGDRLEWPMVWESKRYIVWSWDPCTFSGAGRQRGNCLQGKAFQHPDLGTCKYWFSIDNMGIIAYDLQESPPVIVPDNHKNMSGQLWDHSSCLGATWKAIASSILFSDFMLNTHGTVVAFHIPVGCWGLESDSWEDLADSKFVPSQNVNESHSLGPRKAFSCLVDSAYSLHLLGWMVLSEQSGSLFTKLLHRLIEAICPLMNHFIFFSFVWC